jgi:hypothetical protein
MYIRTNNHDKSWIALHKKECNKNVNWNDPQILAMIQGKTLYQTKMLLDIRKAMEIRLHKTGPGSGFNLDFRNRVKTRLWDPLFLKYRQKMLPKDNKTMIPGTV